MSTRRQRNRAELTIAIIKAASARLHRQGPDALTIRGIADDLEVSPGALYRYYDGLDSIITALITNGYLDLAESIQRHATQPDAPLDRINAAAHAYRGWALDNPHHFQLLFGAPLPDYVAPIDGPTSTAMNQLAIAFLRPLVEAWASGAITIDPAFHLDADGNHQLVTKIVELSGLDAPASIGPWATAIWSYVHGLVALELNGQFRWLYDDDASAQFDASVDGLIALISAT
ncbi:MAG: hypothetical protein CSA55_03025 [Ilumatobacter coccineus]|uniref:HTH tetR-type domain-containing protein n=1 Tax=Ilumatobacter coccineus TaxID=467094 RepID=A0A2G6KAN2_9ACTN|nr:MAG: hypothetical protein CSA55_03025 [Ilumatobacter coccineus]